MQHLSQPFPRILAVSRSKAPFDNPYRSRGFRVIGLDPAFRRPGAIGAYALPYSVQHLNGLRRRIKPYLLCTNLGV